MGRETKLMKMESAHCPDFDDVDLISALPDHLICHILSFLPTKESVATSVLSTRWRFLFAFVPDIDLLFDPTDDFELNMNELESLGSRQLNKFFHLGCRILALRGMTPIRKFKLSLIWVYERFRPHINSFISAALQFKVHELDIYVGGGETDPYAITCPGIFTCESLVYLKLLVHSDIPKSVFLPNLKVLHMHLVGLIDDSVQRLIQGCPLLEELSLELSFELPNPNVVVVDFSSPSIKKLEIRVWGGEYKIVVKSSILESLLYVVFRYAGEHKAVFNVPNLKEFWYRAPAAGVSFVGNLDSLVAARIGVGWLDDQLTTHDAIDHLYRAQRVKTLSIYQHILEVLYHSQDFLPTFNNLTTLELGPGHKAGEIDHILSWRLLPGLFEKAPNLEVLIFNQMILENISESNELECLFLEALPICFIKKLKEIDINVGSNKECGFKLIEYLLQHGQALKKMTISFLMPSVPSVCKRILSFKRVSEDCKIVLD